jgi:ubiquitin-activating enzyme E1
MADDTVDEDLYSRQLYVMGHEAQRKMGSANVLICGLNGVGVEIAKNVILAGVKSVTLYDPEPAQWADLSAQFYLTAEDVEAARPRAAACCAKLAELNQYVDVSAHGGAFDHAFVGRFTAVVMIGSTEAQHKELNAFCRGAGIAYIAADARGLFGGVFVDLGDAFTVSDATGENPTSCRVVSVEPGADDDSSPAGAGEALVTVADDEARHNLESGDFVEFSELVGVEALNDADPAPVRVVGPYTYVVAHDLRSMEPYKENGYSHQVIQPKSFAFQAYAEALTRPKEGMMAGDISKFGQADLVHLGFRALDAFRAAHDGAAPAPGSAADAAELVAGARALNEAAGEGDLRVADVDGEKNTRLLTALAMGATGVISPMAAFLGGVVGQEVLKAVGGKFTPLNGFWYFDAAECLPDDFPAPEAEYRAQGGRYDGQIAVFGATLQATLGALNYFIVGAGAIGCEMLKNWALMGVGCAEGGHVTVTDMDAIEKSNLNRQFLFRPNDVKQLKSQCAARAVVAMNPAMRVTALDLRVGADTETVFNDGFYSNLSAVCTALDNVDARLYVDQRCLFYQLPMMESGTEGSKGNTQIVVPRATENYGASRDPPEKSVPICTLKSFPNEITHTLQWARDWFEGVFNQTAADANSYLSNAGFLAQLQAQQNTKLDTLERVHQSLVADKALSFDDCVVWARLRFEAMFAADMKQLLHNFPLDQLTTTGQPFWSGAKRPPTPLVFDAEDPLHMAFIVSAANLRAENFGLVGERDAAKMKSALASVMVPDFEPKRGLKIAATEAEAKEQAGAAAALPEDLDVDAQCDKILSELPPPGELAGYRLAPVEFEKDDDFHMDMVAACSNLRARNYKIKEADKHQSKLIAGKIIPAIATTTALVTGLVCFEAYKLMMKKPLEAYRNNFVNLALGFMASSEPQPVATQTTVLKGVEWKWSVWDCIEIDKGPDFTLGEFIDHFEEEYQLDVSMLSFGVSILFSFFGNAKKMKERRKMPMTAVVEQVTKKPVNPTAMYLIFELCVSDASGGDMDGEDVDIPYVRMKIK